MQTLSFLVSAHASALAPMRLRPLARAIRVAVAGLLAGGLAGQALAQAAAGSGPDGLGQQRTMPELAVSAQRDTGLPGAAPGGQVARGARLGLLGNADAMDAPFSISSYTGQWIADRQAVTVADVLAGDAAVRSTGQNSGMLDAFFIRGFPVGEGNLGEVAFDGQYGVAPNYRVLADYAERVEVVKGPAALLYGMAPNGGVGGVINIVPKRATRDLSRFTADASQDGQGGGHLDLARRFGAGRQFGLRVNGSHHQGDTAPGQQSRQADVGALAFDYQDEKWRATLDLVGQRERIDAPSRPFMLDGTLAVPDAPDGRRNVTQAWGWSKVDDRSHLLHAEYDVAENVTLSASAGGVGTDVARLSDQTHTILNARGDTRTTPVYFKFGVHRSTADAGLRARFLTGVVRHDVSLQANVYRDRLGRGATNGTALNSNLYAPYASPVQDIAEPAAVPRTAERKLAGLAVADAMALWDGRMQVTLGLRRQNVQADNFSAAGAVTSSYDRGATTPLAGVVFKPWQHMSLYANVIQGLGMGDIAPATAVNAGQAFAPYKTRQREVGVKAERGGLSATLAAFQITKPSGQLNANGMYGVDGEQRNRGLEWSVTGEAAPGVRVVGGAMLLDAELTRTASAATLGKVPVGVPRRQANLGAEWDLIGLPGLTVTAAVAGTGRQYVNLANTQALPGWSTIDLGARYRTSVAGYGTVLRATVQNAGARRYWANVASYSGFMLGAPRTLTVSATVDF
jgi:iron complex outermembrane recepter protein